MANNYTVINSTGGTITMKSIETSTGVQAVQSIPTDTSGNPMVTGASCAPTSTMSAQVVTLSPNGVNANGQATMANSAPVVLASNQTAVPTTVSSGTVTLSSAPSVSVTALDQLWAAGTNGLIASVFSLVTAEMNALASSGTAVSSIGGTAGVFTSSYAGRAIYGEVYLTASTTATTGNGANIAGWFMTSFDGGTTFESTAVAPLARPPDFLIPVPVGTLGSSTTYKAAGLVTLPALPYKVMVQNNMVIVLGSTANVIRVAPIAQQG